MYLLIYCFFFQIPFHFKDEIKEVRQLEEDIPPGTEVLARFPDDGWFYFAVVECKVESKDSYRILDATGNKFEISKGDIILDESVPSRDLQVGLQLFYTYQCIFEWGSLY